MSVCLCNLSADTVLELVAQNELEVEPASPDLSTFSADPNMAKQVLGDLVNRLPRPVELLVGSAKGRRHAAGFASHAWQTSIPKKGFLALDDGLYVTSPEFTLLQQSNQLHQAGLCQMLGRYAGTWSPVKDSAGDQIERAPLTTLERLEEFLGQLGKVRGCGNLRFAMAYTCEGAASAGETSLQLALSLPPQLHGMGIPLPAMNYRVGLSSTSRKLYPHDSIRIDLCWRQKGFGLEYQGEKHGSQLGEDYARWFAAREEGYELWFVAKEQLNSAAQMGHIGREVAKRLGLRLPEARWPSETELQELLDILAKRKHPKPVSYNELHGRRCGLRTRSGLPVRR